MTFNSKNLHYEKQEPAFLRRLRGEHASDRPQVSISRPRKARLETGDDEGPTIVDERGEYVTEQEYDKLLHGPTRDDALSKDDVSPAASVHKELEAEETSHPVTIEGEKHRSKQQLAGTNGLKKRKRIIKAIVADPQSELEAPGNEDLPSEKGESKQQVKIKAKRKKVQLSFDDPAG